MPEPPVPILPDTLEPCISPVTKTQQVLVCHFRNRAWSISTDLSMTFLNTTKDDCHCFQCVCVQCVQSVLSLTALLTEVYCSVFHLYKNTIVGFHQRISSSCQIFFNLFFLNILLILFDFSVDFQVCLTNQIRIRKCLEFSFLLITLNMFFQIHKNSTDLR